MTLPLVYFSASNNTAYVARLIALGLEAGGRPAELIRVEAVKDRKADLVLADVLGVGAPIYGGFAEPVKDWAKGFDFTGKRVFLFSTAGVVHMGSTREMASLIESNGGAVIGAFEMTFRGCMDGIVYSERQAARNPIKKADLERAIDFGRRIAANAADGTGYVDSTYRHHFGILALKVVQLLKVGALAMFKNGFFLVDGRKCSGCGKCVKACPTGAVTVTGKKPAINHRKCIACFKCFKECPKRALALRLTGGWPYYQGPWMLKGYVDPETLKAEADKALAPEPQ